MFWWSNVVTSDTILSGGFMKNEETWTDSAGQTATKTAAAGHPVTRFQSSIYHMYTLLVVASFYARVQRNAVSISISHTAAAYVLYIQSCRDIISTACTRFLFVHAYFSLLDYCCFTSGGL